MSRTMCILVSDDREMAERLKSFGQHNELTVQVYTSTEWSRGMRDTKFIQQLGGSSTSPLVSSTPFVHENISAGVGADKILPFPGSTQYKEVAPKRIQTINELEAQAIENTIHEFNGNLTEAAKALGIGRATLYRKVKQYDIDPSVARRKKVA